MDDYFLYAYIIEGIIKIIGLGLEKYFEDDWNMFDFAMIIMSLFSNFLYSVLTIVRSAKSVKATKILKLTKINRVLKAFRALRSVKIFNFFMIGADVLQQVKLMITRILLCIPLCNY